MKLLDQLWRKDTDPAPSAPGPPDGEEGRAGQPELPAGTAVPRIRVVAPQISATAPTLPFDGREPRAAEQYKLIRTKIVHHPRSLKVIAVSSPQLGDGKTVTAVNVAGAMALKDEFNTLLVDADCRRSRVAEVLGIPSSPGLMDVLAGQCAPHEAIVRLESYPNLYVLPAGAGRRGPSELLDSRNWKALAEELRACFSFVVIDTPPVGVVADYELVQTVADGVVIVVRPDHTNRERCYLALEAVTPEKLVGVVTNCVPDWFLQPSHPHDYDYYSGTSRARKQAPEDDPGPAVKRS